NRALEPSVPRLVDRAEAAAADAALDQKAVEHERTDHALGRFAANPLPPATYSLLLGGFFPITTGPAVAATPPSSAPADPASAWSCARRRAAAADPDRARRQGLPRRAQEPGPQRLRSRRHPDRRRDQPDEQELLRQARRTQRPLGDRIHQPGQR